MGNAFFWGLVTGSSLLIGGLIALRLRIRPRLLGLVMAFGAGVLISAVAYELVLEAVHTSTGATAIALGLFAGAIVFFIGNLLIDRRGGREPTGSHGAHSTGSALATVLGIVLDGVPKSIMIGLTLLEDERVSIPIIAAVFLSNIPEAVAATTGLRGGGWSQTRVMGLWTLVVLVCATSSLAGYALFADASPNTIAFVLAFAGGAILTMLADTSMPEAFEHGGKLVGLATTFGFALAFALTMVE